jgi:exodeoxyribonuclease VII large subunit
MTIKRWTVSEITTYIKQMFELDSRLTRVEVEGEVSNLRVPSSGHAYFTLKDSDAALRCVMWASTRRNAHDFANGDKVIAQGNMSVYERDGQYQLYCSSIKPAGIGDLYAQFEALKAKLHAEGVFEAETKLAPPERPAHIGIVTSPSTAALQDVLNILRRRNPLIQAVLAPASVQGNHAPPQIIDALGRLQAYHVTHPLDAILIVRGGGSLEDLWCFNDEQLARMIADVAPHIPIISGVGHEIDYTLADFAASIRAPTPSAAAELVTPHTLEERRSELTTLHEHITEHVRQKIAEGHLHLERTTAQLDRLSPAGDIRDARQHLDTLLYRAEVSTVNAVKAKRAKLAALRASLRSLDPQATLERGYAIVYTPSGEVLPRAADATPGETITIRLADGSLDATINQTRSTDD